MTTIIGILGAGITLLAFVLNQMDIWKNDNVRYDFLNLIGSSLLVLYAVLLQTYPFLVLNLVWGIVSLRDVLKYFLRN